jgi:SAM-dependent methyltransferase
MFSETGYYAHPELPELYDHIPMYNSRADVNFYVELCREMGEVLELGCGTGRVLVAAAEAGCAVTGLDNSEHMLARCRAKTDRLCKLVRDRVTLVQADMTDFQLARTFKLAIVPFRPIQHLATTGEQLSFLRCVHQHLQPGGRLVFDVFNPNLALLAAPINPDEIEDTSEFTLPDGRRLRRSFQMLQKRYADQCTDCELIYHLDGRRIVQALTMRYFFRFELEHLLARAGFEVTALYGGFDATPFADNSPEMIFVAVRH